MEDDTADVPRLYHRAITVSIELIAHRRLFTHAPEDTPDTLLPTTSCTGVPYCTTCAAPLQGGKASPGKETDKTGRRA